METLLYKYAFGYFFNRKAKQNGITIELPMNHTHKDRLKAAIEAGFPEFDYCVFLYSNNRHTFFSTIPGVNDLYLGTDKNSSIQLIFKSGTFEIIRETKWIEL